MVRDREKFIAQVLAGRKGKKPIQRETLVDARRLIIDQESGCVQAVSSRWMVQEQKMLEK